MKNILYLFKLSFLELTTGLQAIVAQTPANDPAWILQPDSLGSEEFNAALDPNRWLFQYPYGSGMEGGGAELAFDTNLIWTTGDTTLKIKTDTMPQNITITNPVFQQFGSGSLTFAYQGGVLWRKKVNGTELYKFGYIEISAKFPTSCYSLWPGFWLWHGSCGSSPPFSEEIDVIENASDIAYNGYKVGTNTHLYCPQSANVPNPLDIDVNFLLSSDFHKYAIEWAPDRLIWYIDDQLLRIIYDSTGIMIPQHDLSCILSSGIYHHNAFLPANWDSIDENPDTPTCWQLFNPPQPVYFEIDYLRYYKLKIDCNNNLTICSPSIDYSDRAVQKTITTGGNIAAGCAPSFYTSENYTLRATDYVLLDLGTEINADATGRFEIQVLACPQ